VGTENKTFGQRTGLVVYTRGYTVPQIKAVARVLLAVSRMKLSPDPPVIEDRMRHRLAKRYNTPLEKRKLKIKGVPVEFDFVSQNEQIVGQIKSSGPRRKGKLKGRVRRQTQFGDFSRDCLLLAAKQANPQSESI
jgi:hypothetical protein